MMPENDVGENGNKRRIATYLRTRLSTTKYRRNSPGTATCWQNCTGNKSSNTCTTYPADNAIYWRHSTYARVKCHAHLWYKRLCHSSRIHALRRKHASPTWRLKLVSTTKLHRASLAAKNTIFSPYLYRGRQFLGLPLPHLHLSEAIQQPLHHLECVVPGIDRLSSRPCFILLAIW